ncbi:DUF6287 domain-containing protein [Lacticaseibacillus absianus]|uniref:DUF6287 domain-containing protein n=1 Tax=Lacticaseibacillus absianus TaxID=2729623 RepID=UPI0015C74572|nr:DUF6287 domain-containing protein [Lacticaseibacillus absianus]
MSKRTIQAALILGTVAMLGACGAPATSRPTTKQTPQPKTATRQSTQGKPRQPQAKKPRAGMQLAAIQRGDFSSLEGQWTPIGFSANYRDGTTPGLEAGGGGHLTVTADQLSTGEITLKGTTLTDSAGTHALTYTRKGAALLGTLADAAHVAINWAVNFYPKGATADFKALTGDATNQENLIEVWTSNNSVRQIFAQDLTAARRRAIQGLDLQQLAAGNYTSLAGTWVNPADGGRFVVTTETQKRPAGFDNTGSDIGVVISNHDQDDHHQFVMFDSTDTTVGRTLMATLGYWDASQPFQQFDPLLLVPKGVQATTADDSDVTRDRMILGGGQGGFAPQAYYRQ